MRERTPSFDRLVREHHPAVYASALRVLRNEADAHDVTQDVFVRVLDGRIELERGEAEAPILRWHAVRAALSLRKGAQRRRDREDAHAMERQRTTETANEDQRELWGHVQALPEDVRVPLVLRFAEELTFVQIGTALGIAEPTAHDRVRKGLAALRSRLAGAGLVAVGAGLESRLAEAAPVEVPAGLEGELLALRGGTLATAAKLAAWVGGATLVAAGAVFLPGALRGEAGGEAGGADAELASASALVARTDLEPELALPADTAREPARDSELATAALDRAAAVDVRIGWIEGRVVDEQDAPLDSFEVRIASVERAGKMPAWGARVHTGSGGFFRVRVELPSDAGRNVVLVTPRGGGEPVRVLPGNTASFGVVVVARPDGEPGRFAIDVEVVGEDGHAVAGALAAIAGVDPVRTSAAGIATIAGEGLGERVLTVTPPDNSLAPLSMPLLLASGGNDSVRVVLRETSEIRGRIVAIDGSVPGFVQVFVDERSSWNMGEYDPVTGVFVIDGLAPGEHRLRVDPQGWADWSGLRRQVAAGTRDLELVLKPASDPRDVGDHAAEVHGRFVDEVTGEPVAWGPEFGLQLGWIEAGIEGDPERDILLNHLFPPPVQTAALPEKDEDPWIAPAPSARFRRTDLDPGVYLLHYTIEGYAGGVLGPFALEAETIVAGLEVRLQRPVAVRTRVLDPTGKPVKGAYVFVTGTGAYSEKRIGEADAAYRAADGRGSFWAGGGGRTDAEGVSRHERLPRRDGMRLVAIHPGFEPAAAALRGEAVELRFKSDSHH
ncbi:MAG: sigma-70 family RNA polymerase sigma factor [bacterium]|nr:sigma-70 family RNA polymerase sigma factor [bacterium]